jgi:hypothetical protein
MAQLGQQAASSSSYAQHSGQQQKHSFLGGLAQSALGHALSQGSSQPYAQHPSSSNGYAQPRPHGGRAPPPSDAHSSQFFGSDPLAGMHLPPATKALLHYAQKEGILDDIAKYFRVLPPAPNFFYSKCTGRKRAVCVSYLSLNSFVSYHSLLVSVVCRFSLVGSLGHRCDPYLSLKGEFRFPCRVDGPTFVRCHVPI